MSQTLERPSIEEHVSSGGVIAILAGAGTNAAHTLARLNVRHRFGASGGAIYTAVAATGRSTPQILRIAIEEHFGDNLDIAGGVLGGVGELKRRLGKAVRLWRSKPAERAKILQEEDTDTWLGTGLLGTTKLGKFIQRQADATGLGNAWPEGYSVIATTKSGEIVYFGQEGVDLISNEGEKIRLADEPAPLPLAVRASAAIPGVMVAPEYMGMLLFDGAMNRFGFCPTPVRIRYYGVDPKHIVACRIGEDYNHYAMGPTQRIVRRIWGINPHYNWEEETAGVLQFRPVIDHIHALNFELSPDQKWLAILIAFFDDLRALSLAGLLDEQATKEAREIEDKIGFWRDIIPGGVGKEQVLAPRAERAFAEHGLY